MHSTKYRAAKIGTNGSQCSENKRVRKKIQLIDGTIVRERRLGVEILPENRLKDVKRGLKV